MAPDPVMAVNKAAADSEIVRHVRADAGARFATVHAIVRNLFSALEQREIFRGVAQLAGREEARAQTKRLVKLGVDAGFAAQPQAIAQFSASVVDIVERH